MSTDLTHQLEQMKASEPDRIGRETADLFQSSIDDLSRSGITDRALKVGERSPDFSLTNQNGETIRLSDHLEAGPAIVSFYRGGWCPYCNTEMKALQAAMSTISTLGARILAISPQRPEHAADMARENGLTFDLLSDPGNSVARRYGVVFHLQDEIQSVYDDLGLDLPVWNDDDSFDLPVPATYVVDPDAVIRMAFVDPDYTRRLDPTEIVRILRQIDADA